MDPYVKDWAEVVFGAGSLLAVIFGIVKIRDDLRNAQAQRIRDAKQAADASRQREEERRKELHEATLSREQRDREQQWRKAGLAREMLKEMLTDPRATDAMLMLDWGSREYDVDDVWMTITKEEVLEALRIEDEVFEDHEVYVRDCFDAFFGTMQMTQYNIDIDLVNRSDVDYPFSYYASKMQDDKEAFLKFLTKYRYDLALKFLDTFRSWSGSDPGPGSERVQMGRIK